jgi:glycosyltransferase involved in cell wall biosynthesis
MRILLVTDNFPNPAQPAIGTFNLQMARALALTNDVAVIAYVPWLQEARMRRAGKRLERRRAEGRIEIHHPRYIYPPGVLRTLYPWFLWRSVAATAREVLQRFEPDVVLSYWLHPDGAVALRLARMAGVPAVVMSGGSDLLLLTKRPLRRRAITQVLEKADAVVCVSEHLARAARVLDRAGTPVHVVRRGVNLDRFCAGDRAAARARLGWDPGRRALLWVGRMSPEKGLDVLIDACARLPRSLDFSLYLAGDGPLRGELVEHVRRASLAQRIVFAGMVPHGDLPDWFRAADVTVLPSRSEGVPNVLLESIACGTPFVASDVGGVAEIADPRADRLTPAGDADALAAAIGEVLARPSAGQRRFLPQSWERSAAALEEVLRGTIASRGDRAGH